MLRLGLPFIVALVTLVGGNFTIAKAKSAQDIRLVLQITVDGLRADREVVERAIAGNPGCSGSGVQSLPRST